MTFRPDVGVHTAALVDPGAVIGANVAVGPWVQIGPDVVIGDDCVIHAHVVIKGPTVMGAGNEIFPFACVGEDCQDKKYRGENTRLIIGDRNVIREGCTLHRGTVQDQGETRIGSDNLLMANAHVAHDCVIGNQTVIANNVAIGGHVQIGDWAILGGGTLVHQFCRIGAHCMIGGGSVIIKDVPAFITASGHYAEAIGVNTEGLRRRGFSAESLLLLKRAYKVVFRQGLTLQQALEKLDAEFADAPEVATFSQSLRDATRGIVR